MKPPVFSLVLALSLTAAGAFAGEKPVATDHAAHGAHAHPSATPAGKGQSFATLDTNKDGFLSKAEIAKHSKSGHATMVDADKDGRLSPKEFKALESM